MRASTLESPFKASLARRMLSAVRTNRGSAGGEQPERNGERQHVDVECVRLVDQEFGIVGPEASDFREPPRLEEAARVRIDHPGAARPAGGDRP